MTTDIGRREFATLIASACACASSGGKAASSSTVWHMATGYSAVTFHAVNIATMLAEIDDATHGGLRVVMHADNSLVKLPDIPSAVEAGRIEMGECIMSDLIGVLPLAGADTVPFIASSYADARSLWRFQRPLIDKHFAKRGLIALYAVAWPPQGLFTKRPMKEVADFKGSRLRSYGATTKRLAGLLGATPVDVPRSQVTQALVDGRIDSMITSAVTGVESQAWRQLNYFYEINAWFPKNIVFVNAAAVRALPASAQQALTLASARAEARGWEASETAVRQATTELRRNGMKVERLSSEFTQTFKRIGERQSLEWIGQVGLEANQIFVPYFTQR